MRALSIKNPWAWLIIYGGKDIENRQWSTKKRGVFRVHASKGFDWDGYYKLLKQGVQMPKPEEFLKGGIIGEVELIDCVTESPSKWFQGRYGFVLRDPQPLPFVPMKGQLMFFQLKDAV